MALFWSIVYLSSRTQLENYSFFPPFSFFLRDEQNSFFHKCLFVELRHRQIKNRLLLVPNCLLLEFDSIFGSKLIYQSFWRALRMRRQTVSSDMKSKRMIKTRGLLKSMLICQILASLIHFFKVYISKLLNLFINFLHDEICMGVSKRPHIKLVLFLSRCQSTDP